MRFSMKTGAMAGFALAALAAAPVFAHHSFAMFDAQKTVTLEGTIKAFEWTNPHGWVQLVVRDSATGKDVEWSTGGHLAAITVGGHQLFDGVVAPSP
jgi:hypothetical protein